MTTTTLRRVATLSLSVFALSLAVFGVSRAASTYNHVITLEPGWSVISPTRVVETHVFSATENSTNFDIYVLDPSQASGWATMSDLGQSEFTPLYGYFINNKTGGRQTLTLNYEDALSPAERLFTREFTTTGWHSIGVANPTYAVQQCEDAVSVDNAANILNSLSGEFSQVIDYTDGDYTASPSTVFVGDTWANVVSTDLSSLNGLRDTKGYAIFITDDALYAGSQDEDDANYCPTPTPPAPVVTELEMKISSSNPDASVVEVASESDTDGVLLLAGTLKAKNGDITVEELTFDIATSGASLEDIASALILEIDGDEVQAIDPTSADCANATISTCVFDDVDVVISEDDTVTFRLLADINPTEDHTEGASLEASIDNDDTVAEDQDGDPLTTGELTGAVSGNTQSFRSWGIQLTLVSTSESKVSGDNTPDEGTFVIKYKATAFGGDVYIQEGCSGNLTASDSHEFVLMSGGVASSSSSCTLTSVADDDGVFGNFEVAEGTSEEFTLTVVELGAGTFVNVRLEGVDWATDDIANPATLYEFNLDEFETDDLFLSSS